MNREILFRAKRIDGGEWVEGLPNYMWGQLHILKVSDENTAYPVDPTTLGQYTGLTDKNGKRIFEGDICWDADWGVSFTVVWNKEHLSWMAYFSSDGDEDYLQEFMPGSNLEVICTIHDQQEG